MWPDGIEFLINKKSVLKKNFRDGQNLGSVIYKELEIKKGPIMENFGRYHKEIELYFLIAMQTCKEVIKSRQENTICTLE